MPHRRGRIASGISKTFGIERREAGGRRGGARNGAQRAKRGRTKKEKHKWKKLKKQHRRPEARQIGLESIKPLWRNQCIGGSIRAAESKLAV